MKFSIITCTYNSEKYLSRCIASVRGQTFKDYEHIFIDGYSNDNTIKMIDEYKAHNKNVRFLQKEKRGISNAMNEGIRDAGGEYIIHLHSDDRFYDPMVLEDTASFLEKYCPDWIYGKINVLKDNEHRIGIFPDRKVLQYSYKSIFGKYLLKFFSFVPHQAVFIKKQVFEVYGYFDESISTAMDPDLWMRIRKKTTWTFFDRIISDFCIGEDTESSSKKNIEQNRKNIETVQRRYMNLFEFAFARLFNSFTAGINKVHKALRRGKH